MLSQNEPNPTRVAWNPGLGEGDKLSVIRCCLCYKSARLFYSCLEIEPDRLSLGNGDANNAIRHGE